MGELNDNRLSLAILLPPTADGCQIFKPFEMPTMAETSDFFLEQKTFFNNDDIIDVIEYD